MSYRKYKDTSPEETLRKIKEILPHITITLDATLTKRMDGIYSAIVYDAKNWWSTGGKGTTEAYCLASGYAEAIEHLCNYCAYNYRAANEVAQSFGGFIRYPDEKKVSIKDAILMNPLVYTDIEDAFTRDGSEFDLDQCVKCWQLLFKRETATTSPFFSVNSNSVVFLPDEMIGRLSGSTGGGAGNTSYEALGHAFDEISERYAKYQIYTQNLTPPIIPKSLIRENCDDLYRTIRQIEEQGYKVIVKDASLGQGLPVVCVVLIDPENLSYMVKFGAHFSFPVALERCFTEMFQSYSINSKKGNGHKNFHVWTEYDDYNSELEGAWFNHLKDDTGPVPSRFFLDDASWGFEPWGIDINYTNEIAVKQHIRLFSSLGAKDVFIRDLSFLGFPVYKVYIPDFSNSHLTINHKVLKEFQTAQYVIDGILRGEIIDVSDYRDILLNCFSKNSYLGEMILKNISDDLVELCHAALLYELNQDITLLKKKQPTNKYARIVLLNFELEKRGYSSEQRLILFKNLSVNEMYNIILSWQNENVFASLIKSIFKNKNNESSAISWEKYDLDSISNTHISFKTMMLKNTPNQDDIRNILEDL